MSTQASLYSLRKCPPSRSRAAGFSLVEVMVALVIIAIGTLGIAKMQALALANTGASRSRALAAIEASSLAAAMHANRLYWSSTGSLPGNIKVTTMVSGAASVTSDSATMGPALTTVNGSLCPTATTMESTLSCYCASATTSPCAAAPIDMAASDLYDWGWGLGNLLPAATATVTCNNNAVNVPVDCIIAITWTENAVALNKQESAVTVLNGSAGTPSPIQLATYTLVVVP